MSDGTTSQGDTCLTVPVPAILSCAAFTTWRRLLLTTSDENDDSLGNQVATLVIAEGAPKRVPVSGACPTTACCARSRPPGAWRR